ncbi:MAG: arsenite methyltransferase [Bradymonadales bacterium]|nr:arsenite methyltransferase [Bradymonadales bacterium]
MKREEEIRMRVSETYTCAVEQLEKSPSSCCCGPSPQSFAVTLAGYSHEVLAGLPADALVNAFGCGNPLALAEIREGEAVLDLGSGAGIDLLLAARLTGPTGKVIGIDMTPAMIERARANAAAVGLTNVEVRSGIIEELPVEPESIDLVISNCVINLSPEKKRVFAEIYRVLKEGGRFSISDIVADPMPDWVHELGQLYSACISGAIPESDYLAGLRQVGLVDVAVRDRLVYDHAQLVGLLDSELSGSCCCGSSPIPREQIFKVADVLDGKVSSVRVIGRKPAKATP